MATVYQHDHVWVAHELDPERRSWPREGDKRRCIDCGAVDERTDTPFGALWVPEEHRLEITMVGPRRVLYGPIEGGPF